MSSPIRLRPMRSGGQPCVAVSLGREAKVIHALDALELAAELTAAAHESLMQHQQLDHHSGRYPQPSETVEGYAVRPEDQPIPIEYRRFLAERRKRLETTRPDGGNVYDTHVDETQPWIDGCAQGEGVVSHGC